MVTEQDFLDAHRELVPSVSAGELEHYEQVRAMFEGAKDKKKEGEANGAVNGHGENGNGMLAITMGGDGEGAGAASTKMDRKGKGKAVDNEVNGSSGKGKGKEVVSPFQETGGDEDEGLYD